MTIYYCVLQATALDKLTSSFDIINLCILICQHIFTHYDDVLLHQNILAKMELRMWFTILMQYFRLLKQFSTDNNGHTINYPVQIRFINVRFSPDINAPVYEQSFDLNSLHDVPVRITLALMGRLISESLTSLEPYMTNMPEAMHKACFTTLAALPDSVSRVITKNIDIYGNDVDTISSSIAFTVLVKAQFCDDKQERVFLN